MAESCVWVPEKGTNTFKKLSSTFGRNTAIKVFNKITGSDFQRVFGDSIQFDKDGVPTFESIMQLKQVRDFIGKEDMLKSLNKKQPHVEDTLSNVSLLINKAAEFNKNNKEYVAIVDYDDNNNITLNINERTSENLAIVNNQQAIQKINERISDILSPLGVTIDTLNDYQTSLGRVGITEFTKAKNLANGFGVMIAVANNMEGNTAISEEFAHTVIGIYREQPLVKRSIEYIKNSNSAKEILGDQYQDVYDYYNGNEDLIAEEAAGHIFQKALIDKVTHTNEVKESLFKRMVNFILNLFKGLNPSYFYNSISSVYNDYSKLAEDILTDKKKITKEDIQKAKRIATFNALSEKIKVQTEVLKEVVDRAYKAAALQDNLDERLKGDPTQKSAARKAAEQIRDAVTRNLKEAESMAAITEVLELARNNMEEVYKQLTNLEGKTAKDKFTIMRNALYVLQCYSQTIDQIESVTTDKYLEDEEIREQHFMADDSRNTLEEYEVTEDVAPIDTNNKTQSEVANIIQNESENFELSDDKKSYVDTRTNQKSTRVTHTIEADKDGETFDPNSPFVTPSTNIGTGMDELTRDFIGGRLNKESDGTYTINGKQLDEVYPNATNEDLNKFVEQLENFKNKLERTKGIHFITRDVVANGTIDVKDGNGIIHKVSVAGTLDLLGYDDKGNWYIYDMKTHRGFIDNKHEKKWRRQLSLYKKFLEEKYNIKVTETGIIPIKVDYPTPKGYASGTTVYKVSDKVKPDGYNGVENNQLMADGKEFKGASPLLEDIKYYKPIDLDIQYRKLANDPTNGLGLGKKALLEVIKKTRDMRNMLNSDLFENALPEFVEFLKPFVGENISIKDPNNPGKLKKVSIKSVIESSQSDVTTLQAWLTTMADNPDGLLQIFDKVVKIKKDEKRLNVINKSQEIIALAKKYENLGITSYDWMFESDKRNYINKEYDVAAYNKAKDTYKAELDNKYGKYPQVGGEEYKAKRKAFQEWVTENTELYKDPVTKNATYIPSRTKYPSKWSSLSQIQQNFYNEWMAIKGEIDALIGPSKTHLTNTIKIRKSGIERLKDTMSSEGITSFIEGVKSKVMKSFDDDVTYKDARGIRGFDGKEIMKLPLYYMYGGKGDLNDLSTDVIGTLIAYTDMAYNYDAMNQILNPLEIGRELVLHNRRKINATKGNKQLFETFRYGGKTIKNPIYEDADASNFRKVLDDFFESKIYNRYLKDSGETLGLDNNKAASLLLKLGSTVQLGLNLLANMANVGTGLAMQNIEAVAGEFFSARELKNADWEFVKAMGHFIGDIGQRTAKSKLELFDQMFDVRQNFSSKVKDTNWLNRTIIGRLFGPNLQYLGQDAGDHWLYNRSAIAMALRYKLKDKNGNLISLWDALETVPIDSNNPDAGNKLVLKDGVTKTDGSNFSSKDIVEFTGKVRYINQHCFGVYNSEDTIMARRTIVGRFLMQYRDWIPAQFRYRFGAATSNLEKGGDVEGYYRTTGRFMQQLYNELKAGELNVKDAWSTLDDYQRANVKRTIAELIQYMVIVAIASILGGATKDRSWARRMLSYAAVRQKTELGALVPVFMPKEMVKIAKSPFAATNVIDDISGLTGVLNPFNWADEIEAGDYKGHSTAYKDFMKSPFSVWYKTIKRNMNPEKAEKYFSM